MASRNISLSNISFTSSCVGLSKVHALIFFGFPVSTSSITSYLGGTRCHGNQNLRPLTYHWLVFVVSSHFDERILAGIGSESLTIGPVVLCLVFKFLTEFFLGGVHRMERAFHGILSRLAYTPPPN